jgi:spermidine synthase
VAAAVALLLGFAMMTLQTSVLRLAALSLGGSPFSFALVVAVFVLCIALGSAGVGALRRIPAWLLPADVGALLLWTALLYLPLGDGPYYGHWLRTRFSPDASSFAPYQLGVFAALLGAIGPAALFSGASLPLLFDRLRSARPDLGGVAGRLYAWNTLGSVLGALIGGYALFWWLDLHEVYRVAAGAIAAALALLVAEGVWRPAGAALLAAALAGLALLPAWPAERISSGAYRVREALPLTDAGADAFFGGPQPTILFEEDDPSATITVKEFLSFDGRKDRNLVTNGKSDSAALTEYPTLALGGLLPALFADRVERAFVIGLGTGVTAGELARLSGVREVRVAEISAAVIRAAPLFDAFNGGASRNPRIRVVRGDAYRTLLRSPERFDVIFSEPSNPWVAGVEMLFSREFLEQVRAHLTPGGAYAQWLQLYETNPETLALALRTFTRVFDHVSAWYGDGPDLLLVAHARPDRSLDLRRLALRATRPDFAAGLRRAGLTDLPALLAHELIPLDGVRDLVPDGPVHTLMHPRLRHAAARAFHAGDSATIPPQTAPDVARRAQRHALWRRYREIRGEPLPEAERASFARETCRYRYWECGAVLGQWMHEVPDSPAREALQRELRSRSRRRQQEPPPLERVPELSRLFDEDAMLRAGREGVKQAQRATRLYAQFYDPSVPFSRAGLTARWRRCEAEPARRAACRQALAALEAELGPLGIEP